MSWKPEYVILIFISTLISYFCAIQISKRKTKARIYLFISIITNLGILFFFKYFNFFNKSIEEILKLVSIEYSPFVLSVLLPIGISFYTFQTLSYTLDVYTKKIKPEKHFGIFAVYVSFFPQLVAGPIERAKDLLPQFYEKKKVTYSLLTFGFFLIVFGYFKKIVIADKISIFVNSVYQDPISYSGLILFLTAVLFTFQIYCDFSGYSDIAIGVAMIMGFKLRENFRRPFLSKSIGEFWNRWHMSLFSWFKDYIYIPLGGNRVTKFRWKLNILFVFLLSGIWHGAAWTFIIWGVLNGFYIIFSKSTQNIKSKISKIFRINKTPFIITVLQILTTFVLTVIAFIFFRANSVVEAVGIIIKIFNFKSWSLENIFNLGISEIGFIILTFSIFILITIEIFQEISSKKTDVNYRYFLSNINPFLRIIIVYLLILIILIFGTFEKTTFIYFQF